MEYVIWSFKHDLWWGPDHRGYAADFTDAGRYTAAEAGRIVTQAILLESVAIILPIAEKHGTPIHHPYGSMGAIR